MRRRPEGRTLVTVVALLAALGWPMNGLAESGGALKTERERFALKMQDLTLQLKEAQARFAIAREEQVLRHEQDLTAMQAELAAALEAERIAAEAEAARLRQTIEADNDLASLAAAAADALARRREADAALLAALDSAVAARRETLDQIVARAVSLGPQDYSVLVETVLAETPDWVIEAVLETGLASPEPDVRAAAVGQLERVASPDLRARLLQLALREGGVSLPTIDQWASRVVAFSDQYDAVSWSAEQALGPPTITECGDRAGAWTSGKPGPQYIRVGFERAVIPTAVAVHQNYQVGFVRGLVLWNSDGSSREVAVDDTLTECPGVATFPITDHLEPVIEVTVMVDGDHGSYEEVDAILLVGHPLD